MAEAVNGALVALSPTESRVLNLVSLGNSNPEIGRQMLISEDTVKTHLRQIYRRLGALDRAHAVRLAIEDGLLIVRGQMRPATDRDPFYKDTHIAVCFAAEACPCRVGRRPVGVTS